MNTPCIDNVKNWHLFNFKSPIPYVALTALVLTILGGAGVLLPYAGAFSTHSILYKVSVAVLVASAIPWVLLAGLYFLRRLQSDDAVKVFQLNLGTIRDFLDTSCGMSLNEELNTLKDEIFKVDLEKYQLEQKESLSSEEQKRIKELELSHESLDAQKNDLVMNIIKKNAPEILTALEQEDPLGKSPFRDAIEEAVDTKKLFGFNRLGIDDENVRDPLVKQALAKKLADIQACFAKIEKPDVICLQETYLPPALLKKLFPGYEVIISRNIKDPNSWESFSDTAILWNAKKYTCKTCFVPKLGGSVIVRLEENATKTSINVASAHLDGFSLKAYEKNMARKEVSAGDDQLKAVRDRLNSERKFSRLNIIGTDANTAERIYKGRFDCLQEEEPKYEKDENDQDPTIIDAHLRTPEKIDFILAQPGVGYRLKLKAIKLPPCFSLKRPNREYFGDHLPVYNKISLIKV